MRGIKARLSPKEPIHWKQAKAAFVRSKKEQVVEKGEPPRKLTIKEKLATIYHAI